MYYTCEDDEPVRVLQEPMYEKIVFFEGEEVHWFIECSHKNVKGIEFGTSWSPAGRRLQAIKMLNLGGSTVGFPDCFKWESKI